MASIKAVVYDPPAPGFPFLGVVLINDQVKLTLPFNSAAEAESAIAEAVSGLADLAEKAKENVSNLQRS